MAPGGRGVEWARTKNESGGEAGGRERERKGGGGGWWKPDKTGK